MMIRLLLFLVVVVSRVTGNSLCLPDCSSGVCIFDFNVRLTAGQLGYFEVEGCNGTNPTLGMEIGITHKFLQNRNQNFFHPLGFAYYPDGAHDNVEELEPGIAPPGSNSTCAFAMTCSAPMYFLNNSYLGTYSNDPGLLPITMNEDNFGLDEYEPKFFYPFPQWLEQGEFSVQLRFDEPYDKDIFYFCHIHQFMSGRIKLLNGGVPVQEADLPVIPYDYDVPSEYDKQCGSFGMDDYRLPNSQCPKEFVCNRPSSTSSSLGLMADCTETQNCYMFAQMTTGVSAQSEVALFIHQMIPHHENAINMAKTLLVSGELDACKSGAFNGDDPICRMYDIAISIVNDQNNQIQKMRKLLDNYGYPATDDCNVRVS